MKTNTIKPKLISAIITAGFTTGANAAIVINEFDYDQPGTDNAEFIELFNNGSTSSLDNYSIQLINGTNSEAYRTINLTGYNINTNGYFVVCSDTTLVANCDYSFTSTDGWFQNGAPDAVALFEDTIKADSIFTLKYQLVIAYTSKKP